MAIDSFVTMRLSLGIRTYFRVATASWLIGALYFLFVVYSETGHLPDARTWVARGLWLLLLTTFLGIAVFASDQRLDRWVPWHRTFLWRLLLGFLWHTALAFALLVVVRNHVFADPVAESLKLGLLMVLSLFVYQVFYGLFYSYRYYAVTQAEQLRTERWQMELQFESLKSQISPHYLFNCLNTVSSLLYKDAALAEEFIRRMADTLRYVLGHHQQKLVPLREELEFVKAYYFLLQVRYEYHLHMEINVPAALMDTPIPPMTLQLLVENAVKHNAISKTQPLKVSIVAEGQVLRISNSKTTASPKTESFRLGLENIHQRYRFFTSRPITILDEDTYSVGLPLLPKHQAA